jgi:hypothetical protein
VGLRIHTPEQSKYVKEIHYVSEEKPPEYNSDINMIRDAYQRIRKVDADDNSVATDDPRVLQDYDSKWNPLGFSSEDEEEEEDQYNINFSPFRKNEAPLTGYESWPMEGTLRVVYYHPEIFLRKNSLDFPAEITDRIKSGFPHAWLIHKTPANPSDFYSGHIGRALNYNGCCVLLGLASGEIVVKNARKTLPVIPFWGACARCHQLSIVTDPNSSYFCHVGAVIGTKKGRTTLSFRGGCSQTFPNKKLAPANEGWWLALQGPPLQIGTDYAVTIPTLCRPPIHGWHFACEHLDGDSFTPQRP